MSLKSIRESYSKLLTVFNDAGVKLTEAQKADLDTFVLALESTMSKQRREAICKTKLAVESKLDKLYSAEFKKVLESMGENQRLAAKIQNKITKINESKKMATKVNDFLDLYVESVLPKKTIVDYDRMQKLEAIHESLKDVLLVNENSIAEKKAKLEESFKQQKSKCETEVAKMQVKLNESMAKAQQLKRKIDHFKALELLESKTKDLPTFEARAVKKRLAEATAPEIEKKFKRVLESVQAEAKKAEEDAETTLESEVKKIIDSEEDQETGGDNESSKLKENDYLRGRSHNGHLANEVAEEDFETMETVECDTNGDVKLDESEVIDPALMKMWCAQSVEVY